MTLNVKMRPHFSYDGFRFGAQATFTFSAMVIAVGSAKAWALVVALADRILPDAERRGRAEHAKKAYFVKLARLSAAARKSRSVKRP